MVHGNSIIVSKQKLERRKRKRGGGRGERRGRASSSRCVNSPIHLSCCHFQRCIWHSIRNGVSSMVSLASFPMEESIFPSIFLSIPVSDSANNRISVFSADGLPVRQFHGDGPPDSHLKLPRGIAIDQRVCMQRRRHCQRLIRRRNSIGAFA